MIQTSDISQIAAMRQGVDYSFTIPLRGFNLRVRPLSMSENIQVLQAVADRLAALPKTAHSLLNENAILAKETLKLASTSDVGRNDGTITDLMMDHMTPDEIQALFKGYVGNCDRCNPSLDLMTPTQVTELIDALKKSAPSREALALRLTEQSFSRLSNLAYYFLTKDE